MMNEKRREVRKRSLQFAIETANRYAPIGYRSLARWDAMANHVLEVELEDGLDQDQDSEIHRLTDVQRDLLIKHTRQDVATVVYGVHHALHEARSARLFSWISLLLNIILLGILIYVHF